MVAGRFRSAAKVTSNWCSNLLFLLPVLSVYPFFSPFETFNFCCSSVRGVAFDGFVGAREISEAVGMGIKFLDWRWKSECEGYEGWSCVSDMIVVCFHLRCWETRRRGNMACQAAREIQTAVRLQAMGMANCRCLESWNQIVGAYFYNISFLFSLGEFLNEFSFSLFNALSL